MGQRGGGGSGVAAAGHRTNPLFWALLPIPSFLPISLAACRHLYCGCAVHAGALVSRPCGVRCVPRHSLLRAPLRSTHVWTGPTFVDAPASCATLLSGTMTRGCCSATLDASQPTRRPSRCTRVSAPASKLPAGTGHGVKWPAVCGENSPVNQVCSARPDAYKPCLSRPAEGAPWQGAFPCTWRSHQIMSACPHCLANVPGAFDQP